MGVDEKVGSADERGDGGGSIHLSDALVTGRERERCGGGGGGSEGRAEDKGGWGVNKHIFMYGFRLWNALPPQVWLTVRRGASHFFRLTPAHMAWQWLSHHLRRNREAVTAPYSDPTCFASAIRLGNRRERREKRSLRDSFYALESLQTLSLFISWLAPALSPFDKFWEDSFDEVTAALFDLPCSNPPI